MKIAGFRKTSLIDYPGYIAAVVFTQGCNFRCPYCHNPELIEPVENMSAADSDSVSFLDPEYLFDLLRERDNLLDGLVITGGEPLLQPDIISFTKKIKSLGMKVKLDTNGTVFSVLKQLVEADLVDYVAMDIKTTFADYENLVGLFKKEEIEGIRQSVSLLVAGKTDYEFRTTVVPGIHTVEDIKKIAQHISGAKKYVLQNFRPEETLDPSFQEKTRFADEVMDRFKEVAKKSLPKVEIRY